MALERLPEEDERTFQSLMQPQWQQTREQIERQPVVLLVQDTVEMDLSCYPQAQNLGLKGHERGRGVSLQTMLAVLPENGDVLGCALQEPFLRAPAPSGESRSQRRLRLRETDLWIHLVQRLGCFCPEVTVVHVGDPAADLFPFFRACQASQTHFLVRAAQNRRIQEEDGQHAYLLDEARAWPAQTRRPFETPADQGRSAGTIQVQISFGKTSVFPPRNEKHVDEEPLTIWVIRVWEEPTLADQEPWEWVLLTSVPTTTLEHAWQRIEWYTHRGIVDVYHQCLAAGCRFVEREWQRVGSIAHLLGWLSPLAVRLACVQSFSQRTPEQRARAVVEADILALVAAHAGQPPSSMTMQAFWTYLARLGGYPARQGDDPPGWKAPWRGWLRVHRLLTGVRFPHSLDAETW